MKPYFFVIENGAAQVPIGIGVELVEFPDYEPWDEYSLQYRMRQAFLLELTEVGLRIGQDLRMPEPALIVSGSNVFAKHARIELRDGAFWLIDIASTKGLIVNDLRIIGPESLRPGDTLHIGGYASRRLTFLDLDDRDSMPAFVARHFGFDEDEEPLVDESDTLIDRKELPAPDIDLEESDTLVDKKPHHINISVPIELGVPDFSASDEGSST